MTAEKRWFTRAEQREKNTNAALVNELRDQGLKTLEIAYARNVSEIRVKRYLNFN